MLAQVPFLFGSETLCIGRRVRSCQTRRYNTAGEFQRWNAERPKESSHQIDCREIATERCALWALVVSILETMVFADVQSGYFKATQQSITLM